MKISMANRISKQFQKRQWQVFSLLSASVLLFFISVGFVSAASTGDKTNFYVDSVYDYWSREQVPATLNFIGQRAYYYIDDAWWKNLSPASQNDVANAIANLSREFDQTIYPQMTAVYGSEWNPGIDNDPRITILVTRTIDEAGGYFSYTNEYPKSQYGSSNEREMIYFNGTYITNSRNSSFLAHEFQHMITFYQKQKLHSIEDDYWLNEARSEYTSTLLGYDNNYSGSNLERRVKTFLSRPSDSLTEWRNETGDYGAVNIFMQYLVDHYGARILTLMTQNDKVGIASVNAALQDMGYSETFSDIFMRWALSNYLNNCGVGGQKNYCYFNTNLNYGNLHVDPTSSYSLGQGSLEFATWIKDWSPRWYKIDAADGQSRLLQINFEGFGTTGNFKVYYILRKNDGSYETNFMNVSSEQKGSSLFSNFGSQIKSVILIPVNMYKTAGFSSNEVNTPFSLKISTNVNQPVLYASGTLIKSASDPKVYLIEDGVKRWISNADIFIARGYKWADIIVVSASDVAAYPDGASVSWPDGSLVKSVGQPAVYIISAGKKRPFASAGIFIGLGYQWQNIKTISQQELDQYELGATVNSLLHPDGTLVRFSDTPNIYLIENAQKRWIPSINVFLAKKYDFKMVAVVGPEMGSKYPDGTNIS